MALLIPDDFKRLDPTKRGVRSVEFHASYVIFAKRSYRIYGKEHKEKMRSSLYDALSSRKKISLKFLADDSFSVIGLDFSTAFECCKMLNIPYNEEVVRQCKKKNKQMYFEEGQREKSLGVEKTRMTEVLPIYEELADIAARGIYVSGLSELQISQARTVLTIMVDEIELIKMYLIGFNEESA